MISNLIVDQTSTNPAAVAAAEFPVRTQGNPGVRSLHHGPGNPTATSTGRRRFRPAACPSHQTLFIPNVTTDVGLSPPYNSLFTFFGQFFDHGVDQTVKSGGTVFVPLQADDPLITGPGRHGRTPVTRCHRSQRFMVLTRAQNQPGPDGVLGTADDIQDANNTDSPWVDQSQTYTSHASHQVFLREYALNAANHPVSTGKLLGGIVKTSRCRARRQLPAQRRKRHDGQHRHLGGDQAAGRQEARAAAGRHGCDQHPDAGDRPLRQVHPGPPVACRST